MNPSDLVVAPTLRGLTHLNLGASLALLAGPACAGVHADGAASMPGDPRDPSWYWDEFDAALRPRAGVFALVAAALMAALTLPATGAPQPLPTPREPIGVVVTGVRNPLPVHLG